MFAFSAGKDDLLIAMIAVLAGLTCAGLLVAVMLDYPFSGAISISHAAFREGVLAPLIRP
jgi:hypothetical protein